MKTHFLFLLILIYSGGKLAGQNVRLYGSNEMTSTLINKICQDTNGFIWIATEYGLNKFDGLHFTRYLHNENDTTSLCTNYVRTLSVDSRGRLWLGYNNGLQYYDPETDSFRNIHFPNGQKPFVPDIVELQSGEIWVATSGFGLFRVDRETNRAYRLREIDELCGSGFLNCIFEDSRNFIWIGTEDNGLVRLDPVTNKTVIYNVPDIPDRTVVAILENRNKQLLVSTNSSVMKRDDVSGQFVPIPSQEDLQLFMKTIFLTPGGVVYVGTDGQGLKYIDDEASFIYPVQNSHYSFDFHTPRIHSIMEDRDQNLWFSCFQKGIVMLPNEPVQFNFRRISGNNQEMGGIVTAIYRDDSGGIWCGIDNEGLFLLNDEWEIIAHYPEPRTIFTIFEDSDHTLWIGANDGLAYLDRQTGSCHYLPYMEDKPIRSITEDANKNLYISTFGYGFVRYDLRSGNWEQFDRFKIREEYRTNDWINDILYDSRGMLWMAHYNGTSCYDPDEKKFIKHGFYEEVLHHICFFLKEDRSGNIWTGTDKGLYCFIRQTGETLHYSTLNGLSNDVICGIIEDKEGNIWCSTFEGINQIKPTSRQVINYYTGGGLVDKIYNRGAFAQDKQGMVYFGSNNGITSFNPADVTSREYSREVLTTELIIHTQPVKENVIDKDIFRFPYEKNTFTFVFSTMDFRDSENIHYEYRLKRLDSEWNSTLPGVNYITYNHMNPGKYILEVRACKYGFYSPVKELVLIVAPPWYHHPVAYIFYLAVMCTIAVLAINVMRRKQKERLNEAKFQFFINISHEIRSPLTLILSPLEKLMKDTHDAPTVRILQSIHRNANRILGLVNQLLDLRRFDKGQMKLAYSQTDLVGFIQELYDVFAFQATQRNMRFKFDWQGGELPVWIDRTNFDKVLMNLLSNAFKYTPDGGEIIIELTTGKEEMPGIDQWEYAEIRILDSGIGIEEDKIDKIFERFYQVQNTMNVVSTGSGIGLHLSRLIIELHKGTLMASNRKDIKGSCFIVRIPLGKYHLQRDELIESSEVKRILPVVVREVKNTNSKKMKSKTNYKILIIDDEVEIRDYLSHELGHIYKIITAANGVRGLQQALAVHPDLIISDVMMNEMDGFTLVKKIRGNNNISHIPVILLSSKAEQPDRIEGIERGADAYLTKPFHIDELLVTIHNLINTRLLLKGKFSGSQDQENKVVDPQLRSNDELFMERVMAVVNENIGNTEFSVEMLAEKSGVSRTQLHRKLKEITGVSASDFIRNIRLKQAARLLKERKTNISQIGYMVGFSSQTHFSTAFKKFYGVSPKDYLNQH